MENAEYQKQEKHIILLDISLFILDMLSREKIEDNYLKSNIELEIPGALVDMIEGARAGNHVLRQFIRAYLYDIRKNAYHKKSDDKIIQKVVQATEQDIKHMEYYAYENILNVFSPIIEGGFYNQGEKQYPSHFSEEASHHLIIKRYDPILDVSPSNIEKLRKNYKKTLGLQEHPWLDLYFLQIYHAQHVGNFEYQTQDQKRKLLSVGRGTVYTFKYWNAYKKYETSYPDLTQNRRATDNDIRRNLENETRRTLHDVVDNFFQNHWIYIAATTAIAVDVVLGIPATGIPGLEDIAMAVIGFGVSEFIPRVFDPETPEILRILFFILVILLMIFVFSYYAYKKIFAGTLPRLSTSTSTPTMFVFNTPTQDSTATPLIPETPTYTITPSPQPSSTPTVIPTQTPFVAGYCKYVTQLGDTAQSISSWFGVSEEAFRAENNLVPGTEFSSHIMVTVNTSCCAPIGNQGFTHVVQKGDTLQNIARRNNLDVYFLATSNHLQEPWYIQDGQMLCIPK